MRNNAFWLLPLMLCLAAFAQPGFLRRLRGQKSRPAGRRWGSGSTAPGPLLVRMDPPRDRLVLANTLTSSVTLIDCHDRSVRNIPVGSRVPQYLKSEALAIDSRSGNVYVIGDRTLEVVFPASGRRAPSPRQAIRDGGRRRSSGNAFLVGRESRDMACVDLKKGRVSTIPWSEKEESARTSTRRRRRPSARSSATAARAPSSPWTATPPPCTRSPPPTASACSRRPWLVPGARWHFAAYSRSAGPWSWWWRRPSARWSRRRRSPPRGDPT